MKEFLDKDFLLSTATARRLYHEVAAPQPIIDFHNHLPAADIAGNRQFANLYEAWLEGDHYKWRAMRSAGIDERYCTGDATPREKFNAWAATVPKTLGNPLYHWTHLELRRYFDINELLSPATADLIWEQANAKLTHPDFRARGLLRKMSVETACTTEDPIDNLAHHQAIRAEGRFGSPDGRSIRTLPTFRPDKAHDLTDVNVWNAYIAKLSAAAGIPITDWNSLSEALARRHSYFHENGCRVSDHGVEYVPAIHWTASAADAVARKALKGKQPSQDEVLLLRSAVLEVCGRLDSDAGWVMQIHMGAIRSVNSRHFENLGPDTGFDVIGDFPQAGGVTHLLDRLDRAEKLPKTILYNLNPRDNELLATIIGAFQGGVPGKIQFGSGWWFNDQLDGMQRQLTALSSLGLLSQFVGMLTDSRSFLSFPRHEYFRRILCKMIGNQVENGELPNEPALLDPLIRGIAYENAFDYFKFPE